jgi:integrase
MPNRIDWKGFRERYENEKLISLSLHTAAATATAFNHLERLIDPKDLLVLDERTLSRFQMELRNTGIEETSIATHLRHLRAALSWAVSMRYLASMPRITMPRRARNRRLMRGRPLSETEFASLLSVVPTVRPIDAEDWERYLTGLWLSGLRLTESIILSWDDDEPFMIDLGGRQPRFRIYGEAEKGGTDRYLPMTPDFAQHVLQTPVEKRRGHVFFLPSPTGRQMKSVSVGRIVSQFGEEAKIVVNSKAEKFASAHDLRRSFGTRWASRVKPATLQLLMRHESIETTLKYYVDQDADDIADLLWKDHGQPFNAANAQT